MGIEIWNTIERVWYAHRECQKFHCESGRANDKWLFFHSFICNWRKLDERRLGSLFIVKIFATIEAFSKFLCIPNTNKPKLKQLKTHTGIIIQSTVLWLKDFVDRVYSGSGNGDCSVMTQCVEITSKSIVNWKRAKKINA